MQHAGSSGGDPSRFEVSFDLRGWLVMADTSPRPLSRHVRRSDAVALATGLARRVGAAVRIREVDGSVRQIIEAARNR